MMSTRKASKVISTVFIMLLLFCVSFPTGVSAASDLSLTVSYRAKCGTPTTFTVNASGGTGNYLYYLGNITRDGEDGQYYVVDPSHLPDDFKYKKDNRFQFTFYASGTYYLDFYVMDKSVMPVVTKRARITVKLNDPAYPSIEKIADSVAAQCKASCRTDYDRALWLHDWLVDHCSYDYNYNYCGAEGALARGKGTCESYHRAYTMLLNRVGIANGRMEGNGHVWTAVRMDGNWYQVDVTWDDNGYSNHTYENYLYFGLNDAIMKLVHTDHYPHKGYESNALANHYLIRSGGIRRWSDPLTSSIQRDLDAGRTTFTLSINSSLPDDYNNVLYNLAAYQLSNQTWSAAGKPVRLHASYSSNKMKFTAEPVSVSSKPDSTSSKPSGTVSTSSKPSSTVSAGSKPSGSANTSSIHSESADTQPGPGPSYTESQTETSGLTSIQPGALPSYIESGAAASTYSGSVGVPSAIASAGLEEPTSDISEAVPSHYEAASATLSESKPTGGKKSFGKVLIYLGIGLAVAALAVGSIIIIRKRR